MSPLPQFASQWIKQWKQAAPLLQAIRDEELRRLGDCDENTSTRSAALPLIYQRYPERHGMVIMQKWFMRRHLLEQSKLANNQANQSTKP